MSDLELIDSVPITAIHDDPPIPDLLRDFTVEIYKIDDERVQLRVCIAGQALAVMSQVCTSHATQCIESVFLGLHYGFAATKYKRTPDGLVPKNAKS